MPSAAVVRSRGTVLGEGHGDDRRPLHHGGAERFGGGDVPEPGRAILAADAEHCAVGAEGQRGHRTPLAERRPGERPAGLGVPDPGLVFEVARGRESPAVRAERGRGESLMPQVVGEWLASRGVPEAGRRVMRSGQEHTAVGAEGDFHDPILVRHGAADGTAGRQVPQPRLVGRVDGPHGQRLAVGAEGHAEDDAALLDRHAGGLTRHRVPEPDGLAVIARGNHAAVRAERQRRDPLVLPDWRRQRPSGGRVPEVDGAQIAVQETAAVKSWLAVATRFPSGLKATVRTFRAWRSGAPERPAGRGLPEPRDPPAIAGQHRLLVGAVGDGLFQEILRQPGLVVGAGSTDRFMCRLGSRGRDRFRPISQRRAV